MQRGRHSIEGATGDSVGQDKERYGRPRAEIRNIYTPCLASL